MSRTWTRAAVELKAHSKFLMVAAALVALNVLAAATNVQLPIATSDAVAQTCPVGPKSDCSSGQEVCGENCSACVCWICEDEPRCGLE